MKPIKNLFLIIICVSVVTACKNATYRKTPGGMPYKVFKGNGKEKVKMGDFIKVVLTQKINDSLLFTTGKLPIYLHVAPNQQTYDVGEVWSALHVGDSIVATQMMDTFILRSPQAVPPQFKKGDKIMTYAKVVAVFANDSLARLDDEKGKKDLLAAEIKELENYLTTKNITAQKTASGTFVQIINPGTGSPIDSGKYVTVYYTGTSFSGVKFDSNTDTSFHHTEPLPFVVGTGSMIKGVDESVTLLKPGGVAKVFIPSMLGYAGQPGSPLIKPYEHLIFDIEIKEVKDQAPPRPEMSMPQRGQGQKVNPPQPK